MGNHRMCRDCGTSWDAGEPWESDHEALCPVCDRWWISHEQDLEHAIDAICEFVSDNAPGVADILDRWDLNEELKKSINSAIELARQSRGESNAD